MDFGGSLDMRFYAHWWMDVLAHWLLNYCGVLVVENYVTGGGIGGLLIVRLCWLTWLWALWFFGRGIWWLIGYGIVVAHFIVGWYSSLVGYVVSH